MWLSGLPFAKALILNCTPKSLCLSATTAPPPFRANERHTELAIHLSKDEPLASISLNLLETGGVIEVHADGQLAPRGSVVGASVMAKPVGVGVFSLRGIPENAHLRVRSPSFAPACIVAMRMPVADVFLQRGRAVIVQLPSALGASGDSVNGSFVDLPGSQCPVPLAWFAFGRTSPETVAINDFPVTGKVMFVQGGKAVVVEVRAQSERADLFPAEAPVVVGLLHHPVHNLPSKIEIRPARTKLVK